MADENVIQKIIRLVLDRKSADDTQKETEGALDKVDKAWKDTAKKIAGYLGVAFLAKKMVDFGIAAVNAARESEAAWSDLEGTIAAAGESFAGMESQVRAAADAFQASTIHDDDAYAKGLSRLITLSGDVAASTNNMGLVADVAAKFFNGDLAPATDLVAKAMNGNTAALGKMGIKAEGAQQALEILAARSMGAATKEAGTFSGQLAQLNNGWDDFLKDVGNAIIGSEGASTAMNALKAVVQVLTDWVGRNKEAIASWVTRGVNFAITAADILYRALKGVAEILAGGLQTSLGLAGKAIAFSAKGWVGLANAASLFLETIGAKETSDKLDNMAGSLLAQANALDKWADAAIKAGSSKVQAGIDTLSKVAFSPADFKPGGKGSSAPPPLKVNAPMIGHNAELSDADKAWQKFDQTIAQAKATISGTGAEIKFLEAQIDAVNTLMKDLATAGVKPTDDSMRFLGATVRQLNVELEAAKKGAALAADWKQFADETTAANLTAEAFGSTLVDLQGEANRLQSVIKNLIADGIDPHDEALQALIERLGEVQDAIDSETAAMQFQQQVAGDLAQALFASFGGGLGPFARMKAKQNYLEATENGIRAVLAALTGFGALHAGKYAAAAAQHAALGAAWSALASSVGGPSGSGPAATPGGGSNPGSGLGTARTSSGSSSRNAQQPTPITEIHFVGPGFDAMNPTVQKVVRGAEQEAIERAGNVRVRVVRSNS